MSLEGDRRDAGAPQNPNLSPEIVEILRAVRETRDRARQVRAHARTVRACTARLRRYGRWHYALHFAGGSGPRAHVIGVVDDDASIVRALTRMLRAVGFGVEPFTSGEEVLWSPRVETVDCLILDYHLGEVTGFEVHERLVARGLSCPVVFITADEDLLESERARRRRATWLAKPVDAAALLATIERAFARRDGAGTRAS